MNSGVEVLELAKNQYAYGVNTTCRGRFLTHRPAYRKQILNLDAGISLAGARFQGACYYDPDLGAESIVAQIGGRLYQFVPDTIRSATVYDRTIKEFFNGESFVSNTTPTNLQYSVILQNINDTSGATYPAKTILTTDPSYITSSAAAVSVNPVLVSGNTQIQYTFLLPLPVGFNAGSIAVGSQVFVGTGIPGQIKWNVLANNMTVGAFPALQLRYTAPQYASGTTITYSAGEPVFYITNPSPPANIATTSLAFTAPAPSQTVSAVISAPFPGMVGQGLLIGGFLYAVSSIPQPIQTSTVTTQTQSAANNSLQFAYDPNPASLSTAWLWQAENYVIVNDGYSRPVFFNGVSSRRSITPTFIGTNTESFSVPQIGQVVSITLNAAFQDAIGTFINVSALNLFPFLMQVIGIDGDTITAVNINGQTAVNSIIPIGSNINSTASPTYTGVLSGNISLNVPAPGTAFNISVTPAFNGVVGDNIILTDGTGALTSYTFNVTAIAGGGSSLTVTNVNAPTGTIVQVGYPLISENLTASELPVGRMGAYVQGRNWISMPDGKSFIVSDQNGDSSGTKALNFRDAVLKWSLNTAQFPIPGGAGQINCIIALNTLDASLGQGALQILCDNDIFTCSASSDSTTWAATTSPILAESIIGFGGVGQSGAVVSNGDLIFKSQDGAIHSLKLSRQDFDKWGNLPISQEVNRVIEQENLNQLSKITETIADNRSLVSCSPIDSAGGIYSQGLIAIDFDVTSSLQGKLPSVYDGIWKDGNFLQLISGKFNKVDRTFAFLWNETGNTVELWEILKDGTADDDGTSTPRPIVWPFESPLVFNDVKGKGEFDLVKLDAGAVFISGLIGNATIKVWYRPDFDSCWHFWTAFSVCAENLESQIQQYRMRIGLGMPPTVDCDPTVNKFPNIGRFFQTRIEVTGSLTFMGAEFYATPKPETFPPPKTQSEGASNA